MKENSSYLNVGCGKRFHSSWINIDVLPADPVVTHHDVTKGIPFENESLEVVYHSHVLEHIPKPQGEAFIGECYRVLKKGGILRVVVPDLEQIARNYLKFLEQNLKKPTPESKANYDWMMLEMYDQVVRNNSGGQMLSYLSKKPINESFIISRLGDEVRPLISGNSRNTSLKQKLKKFFQMSSSAKVFFIKSLFGSILHRFLPGSKYYKIGRFRQSGEIHQWMYDRYSLKNLLEENGFTQVKVCGANESAIANWSSYKLDADGDHVYKPDSLFIEGIK